MRVALVYLNNERNVGRGAGDVAAAVLAAGHDLAFFDTYFTPLETVVRRVAAGGFDALLLSSMTMLFPQAARLARLVKRRRPDLPVLAGGIHATILGGRLLDEHPEIDYLCVGEGESMVVEFLARLRDGGVEGTPNLVHRRGGAVVANPLGPAEDLARLAPFPWHLFPREAVVLPDTGFLYVTATRGCPYNCSYCANGVYLKHYGRSYLRLRPIPDVVEELRRLDRVYRPSLFYFGDEMILSDPDRAVELFEAVRRRVGRPYGCMARVEHLTPPIVRAMADTGCRYVAMGVECGDEDFRRRVLRRAMTDDQIERAFALVKDAGIFATSFNMVGFPFENDPALTEATLRLNERIKPDYVQVSIFYPFPGTALYDRCVQQDLIDPRRLARTTDYFKESVLRGVRLRERVKAIHARLNPGGFRFARPSAAAPAEAPAAPAPDAAGGPAVRRLLLLALDEADREDRALARARALAADGHAVDLVLDLDAVPERHARVDGVRVHRLGPAGPRGWPRHPAMEQRLAMVPPSHMRLRRAAARVLRLAEMLLLGRDARREFARRKLEPFAADVVHVRGEAGRELGAWCAEQWGARLVGERLGEGPA